jgi:hypothetical protein
MYTTRSTEGRYITATSRVPGGGGRESITSSSLHPDEATGAEQHVAVVEHNGRTNELGP